MKLATVILLAAALPCVGCVATVRGSAAIPAPVVSVDYTPVYYNGYVVYYDDGGAPYYLDYGRRIYISAHYSHYPYYVRHYHVHRTAYRTWERHHYPVHHRAYRPHHDYDRRRATRPAYPRHYHD